MAKQSPTLYSVSKTFMWFTIVSLLLTGSLVGIVWLDYNREWKGYQKRFTALKLQKTREELKKADQGIDKKKLDELKGRLTQAQQAINARRADVEELRHESDTLDSKIVKVRTEYQTEKQFEDSYRYYLEESRRHARAHEIQEYEKKLGDVSPKVALLKDWVEALEKDKEAKDTALAKFREEEKALQKEIGVVLEERVRVEKRADKLEPSLAKDILNAPMLDFVAPTLQIQQIVLENLQDDYHFAKVQKVDRCITCHLGIDQKGFEDAPQPFTTHPNLDLYLSALSAHPQETFGCTSCHGGSGQAVSFIETAHTPDNEHQKIEWQKKHRWVELEKWDNKMLPMKHVQASCVKCHNQVVEVPRADKLNEGRELATRMGCFNCHKVEGFHDRWKVGPDLGSVKNKLSEDWVVKWLENPKDFRPSTQMPRVFHLNNTSDPESRQKNEAAIQGIAAYLIKNSSDTPMTKPPVAGEAFRGETLIKDLGCLGCHSAAGIDKSHHGPELSNLGSKVSEDWLYTWLKNPKHLASDTRMPDLRLSDQEASDITAYLLTQKNESFDAKPPVKAKREVVDNMLLESLQGTMRRAEAEAELKRMSEDEKMQFLGKKSIAHQGCFGCHSIRGFEDASPVGADLSDEGRKDIHKFDFGFVDVEHTREAWIHQKLKDPRSFDQGKIKGYYDKLRMPQFELDENELEALTTFMLSLTQEQIPVQMQRIPALEEAQIEKGRLLVQKLHCAGCHTLDGKTGTLRDMAEDLGSAPPVLNGEGAKVQEEWLHSFLKAPTPIRPWLKTRMPNFHLNDQELDTLVFYFHHLADQKVSFAHPSLSGGSPEAMKAGKQLFDAFQCVKCHQITQDSAAMGTSFLAPDLRLTKERLKSDWVRQWIADPQTLEEGTMMPTFFADGQTPMPEILGGDASQQIEAIRDYLYQYEPAAQDTQK